MNIFKYIFPLFIIVFSHVSHSDSKITWDVTLGVGISFLTSGFVEKIDKITINGEVVDLKDKRIITIRESNKWWVLKEWNLNLSKYFHDKYRLTDTKFNIYVSGRTGQNHKPYYIQPDCEVISSIIYDEILNKSKYTEKINKEIKLNLNDAFESLKRNKLMSVLAHLKDVRLENISPKCIEEYHLLKYIDNDEKYGFDTRSYDIPKGLSKYLESMMNILEDNLYGFRQSLQEVEIKVIGYADERNIKKDDPIMNQLYPQNIYYDITACPENDINRIEYVDYKQQYTSIDHKQQYKKVPEKIVNNCQLSAIRAFNVISNIDKYFNSKNVRFVYAAGGEFKNDKDYSHSRKIDIEVTANAAK